MKKKEAAVAGFGILISFIDYNPVRARDPYQPES